ncbi:MAG: MmgE/PrpD family protein, partial [Candidatus Latescibacteria bacterium]|nr:MmgE/PrpD family protein [Candidatus Latescibacterota bacterium]
YPTCRNMHPAIDLSLALGREHDIHPDEIKEILVKTYHIAIKESGNIWEPQDATEAKFSMPYAVAVALIKRSAGLKEFSEPTVSDRNVLRLAGKVRIERDEKLEKNYPAVRGAEVTVTLKNGSSYAKREDLPKGEPENPLTDEELKEKFFCCVEEIFDAGRAPLDIDNISAKSDTQGNYLTGRAEEIIKIVENLEEIKDVNTLISMLDSSKHPTRVDGS